MGSLPKLFCDLERINFRLDPVPPARFVTGAMDLLVVCSAKWDRKFVAHFEPERSRLGKPHMVGVCRRTPAQ
jgi:hypothetical protein